MLKQQKKQQISLMKGYESTPYVVLFCIAKNGNWIWRYPNNAELCETSEYVLISRKNEIFYEEHPKCKLFEWNFDVAVWEYRSSLIDPKKEYDEEKLNDFLRSKKRELFSAEEFANVFKASNKSDDVLGIRVKFVFGRAIDYNESDLIHSDLISSLKTKSFCRLFEIWEKLTKNQIESGLAIQGQGKNVIGGLLGAFNKRALKKDKNEWILENNTGLKCENTYRFLTSAAIKRAKERARKIRSIKEMDQTEQKDQH